MSPALNYTYQRRIQTFEELIPTNSLATTKLTMQLIALLFGYAVSVSMAEKVNTVFGGCNYSPIGVEPWYNCNDQNGGSDPCAPTQNCFMACGRAGSKDKASDFVMVAEWNGGNTCNCECWLK
ncbi:hypothetical protein HII31_01734 [Pseudocercospora fuligena]|uniref:Uncharacterized protein n=1 Tax=Pseudocercospora fuligena TaxID=685502 RepID=A0A8H6RQY6_9PEZI|nr:hypothetical protein HII31_01734 [Pseudocercospora fuligena]